MVLPQEEACPQDATGHSTTCHCEGGRLHWNAVSSIRQPTLLGDSGAKGLHFAGSLFVPFLFMANHFLSHLNEVAGRWCTNHLSLIFATIITMPFMSFTHELRRVADEIDTSDSCRTSLRYACVNGDRVCSIP